MKKLEHIGIAVKNLAQSELLFAKILGSESYKRETVETEKVHVSFFRAGPNKIELIEASDVESPVKRFLDNRGEGIHHVAFEVEDILQEMSRLKKQGFQLIHEQPRRGADNKLVCFIHPRSANGVLIELCQEIKDAAP